MAYESEDVRVYLVVYLLSEWCVPVIKSIKKAKGAEPPGAWFYRSYPTRWMWWMVTIRCLPPSPPPPTQVEPRQFSVIQSARLFGLLEREDTVR
jgi:hypothetical protein